MALDLSSYGQIGSSLFVRIEIFDDTGTDEVLTFSDAHKDVTIDSTTYIGLGQLLDITQTTSELRTTPQELTITVSGIPSSVMTSVLTKKIKGSSVLIQRVIYDVNTGEALSITGNPAGRFRGVVDNFAIADDMDEGSKTGTVTISFICANIIGILERKTNGRETNPTAQKALYAGDLSMDRVPNLTNANFNFGKAAD